MEGKVEEILIFDRSLLREDGEEEFAGSHTSGGNYYHLQRRAGAGGWGGGGTQRLPSVCFGTGIKRYITQADYMWRTHMHKCRDDHAHTQAQTFLRLLQRTS